MSQQIGRDELVSLLARALTGVIAAADTG